MVDLVKLGNNLKPYASPAKKLNIKTTNISSNYYNTKLKTNKSKSLLSFKTKAKTLKSKVSSNHNADCT